MIEAHADAVQLASALIYQDDSDEMLTFVCADANLLNAATTSGLAIENPNTHF